MMLYTCKVTLGAGLWLTRLTGDCAQADDWYREHGLTSYYGMVARRPMETASQNEMTAAHRHLPLVPKSWSKIAPPGNKWRSNHGPGAVCRPQAPHH